MVFSTMISKARYECVVCRVNSLTLADLHRHQTYRHTSEELSLSSIVLRSSLINKINTADATSVVSSMLRNPQSLSELYACSAKLLNDGKNNIHHITPIDYALDNKNDSIGNEPFPSKVEYRLTERELKSQKLSYRHARFMSKGVLDLSCKISPLKNKRKTHRTAQKQSKRKIARKPRNIERIQQSPEKNVAPVEISAAVEDFLEETCPKSVKINRQRKKTASMRNKKSASKVKLSAGRSTKTSTKREITLPIPSNDENDRGELNLETVKIRLDTMKGNLDARGTKKPSTKRRKTSRIEPNKPNESPEIQSKSTEIDWQTKRSTPRKTKVTKKKRSLSRKVTKSRTKREKIPIVTRRDTNDRKEIAGEKEINDSQEKQETPAIHRATSKRKIVRSKSTKFAKISKTVRNSAISKDDREEEIHPESSKINESENVDETLILCKVESSRSTNDTLRSSKTVPLYPPNMDERSILVLDPVLDQLVWTTLVLAEETNSDRNNNDDSRKYTKEITMKEENFQKTRIYDDSEIIPPMKKSRNNLLYFREDTTNFQRDESSRESTPEIYNNTSSDGEYAWHRGENIPIETLGSSRKIDKRFPLDDEEKLPIRSDIPRPRRIRSTPDRFVPY